MKKINALTINDEQHLDILADNIQLNETSYPELKREKQVLIQAYQDYVAHSGNPWFIQQPNLSERLKSGLLKHYDSPPVSINFLDRITKSSPEVCPMCGGFKPFTRDHILPKADHQTWAIFSKNLVPACDCNLKRGSALKGDPATGARVLHPYFDNILLQRLLSCEIAHSNNFARFSLKITYVDPNHPDIAAIKYHTRNVVIKSGIEGWLKGQLSKLKERPSNVIQTLPRSRALNEDRVKEAIEDCLERTDELTGTPNNWLSIFCHGLLNSAGISSWVTDMHNQTLVPR
jgi:hypothetical protein